MNLSQRMAQILGQKLNPSATTTTKATLPHR
jgi:hypothetical protein